MPHEYANSQTPNHLEPDFLSRIARFEVFIVLALVTSGFALVLISLTLSVTVTPSTNFGESIEGVVPPSYWVGIVIMLASICYMLSRLDKTDFRIPFLISCVMLIFSTRAVLAILSPFPPVADTWRGIYIDATWLKYGILSPSGLALFSDQYLKGWPVSFLLAYLITRAGVPVYTFYSWAPTAISILELIVVYFLFKELANRKIGLVSAFLFTLLNTTGFFPFHYSPQTVGALFYLVAMYTIVKAYKTRKLKHLALALFSIFAVVLTHHMSTLFLGISLAGAYFSQYLLGLQHTIRLKNSWLSFNVKRDTIIRLSLSLPILIFALWYFYGFLVYGVDATWMLTEIMRLLTTHQPRYQTGYYGSYLTLSPLIKLSVIVFPVFIFLAAAIAFLGKMRKKKPLDGYLWLIVGWVGAMALVFILGNMLYGNYIEPLRALELITVALYPAAGLTLLAVFESPSLRGKILVTIVIVVVAFFSVLSIYRGAQSVMFFEPPWWMAVFNSP